jgi:hypothetical protein
MNVQAVREAIADALSTVASFVSVFATVPARVSGLPCAVVAVNGIDYHESMTGTGGSLTRLRLDVVLLVQPMAEEWNQATLDALLSGAGSAPAALETDQSLGGTASAVVCTRALDYGSVRFADGEYIGARLAVEVFAT